MVAHIYEYIRIDGLPGRPRPEEVVWAIKRGRISKGVPTDIKQYVKSLDIQSAPEFTAYEEGSPTHPSWPAMHAASGSSSLWMAVIMDLNDEQLCQARLTDYAIAYSRTVAVSVFNVYACCYFL